LRDGASKKKAQDNPEHAQKRLIRGRTQIPQKRAPLDGDFHSRKMAVQNGILIPEVVEQVIFSNVRCFLGVRRRGLDDVHRHA
jgi:hypothetical protein